MTKDENAHIDQAKYVTFNVDRELFGVHIATVQQIISPEQITSVPRTPSFFMGMLNLRGETISAIDLRRRFQLPPIEPNDDQRILIVDYFNTRLGILVDAMGSVVNVNLGNVRPPPPLIDESTMKYLIGSIQLEQNRSLLLLDQERLINPREFEVAEVKVKADNSTSSSMELITTEPELVLVGFRVKAEYYVLEVEAVEEIIKLPPVTYVPQVANVIKGVFHLRDQVIPLIQIHERLGLGTFDFKEGDPVLVVSLFGVKIGMHIGEITGVMRRKKSSIEPLPKNIHGHLADHLKGIIQDTINGKHVLHMVLLLERLFNEEELDRLSLFHESMAAEISHNDDDLEEILYLLRFKIAEEVYAIRLLQINQITGLIPILSIPKAPDFVKGVINVRGEIITVIDLPRMFNSTKQLNKIHAKIIIVDVNNRKVGVLVEEVMGIRYLSNRIFELPDDWGNQEDNQMVEAIGREDDDTVTVLVDIMSVIKIATTFSDTKDDNPAATAA